MKKIILLLVVCCMALSLAYAAQRVVVAEDFTGTWCPWCPSAAQGLDQLYNEAVDSLIVLGMHSGDVYETPKITARINLYGAMIPGYPTVIWDGVDTIVGGSTSSMYPYYRPVFDSHKTFDSPFTISQRLVARDPIARTGRIEITVRNVSAGTHTGCLQFAVVERNLPVAWQTMSSLDFVVRDLLPDANGDTITLAAGDSVVTSRDFTIDPSWNMSNCQYVSFIQRSDRLILQGAQLYFGSLVQERCSVTEVGNGDGYFQPGEGGQIAVWVKNKWAPGSDASVRLQSDDPYVTITSGQYLIGAMQPNDSSNNQAAPFAFTVSPSATMPEGHRVRFLIYKSIYSSQLHDTVTNVDSVFLTVGSPTVIFSDNFEAGRGHWVVGKIGGDTTTVNWDTTSAESHSPGFCVTDSRWGNYKRGIFRYIAMAESVNLTPYSSVTVSWWEKFATQPSLDQCRPMYSANNGKNWNVLDQYSGDQPAWRQRRYTVVSCDTIHAYKLRFMITSNTDTITADGWYVDDVAIMGYTKAGVEGGPAGQPTVRGIAIGCYPNPSLGATMFNYTLPQTGCASLALYDICGRLVTTLASGPQQAGAHSVHWNGADRQGRRMPSGVYFYRLDAGGRSATGKLIMIK